jgi:hypothetical protein
MLWLQEQQEGRAGYEEEDAGWSLVIADAFSLPS